MPDRASIEDFLAQQHVAVVGVSRDPHHFADGVYRHLMFADPVRGSHHLHRVLSGRRIAA